MAVPSMDGLAQELEPQKIVSIFVYTHEAHPGEYYPHHTSFEQKQFVKTGKWESADRHNLHAAIHAGCSSFYPFF
jgi:hypothetical protein